MRSSVIVEHHPIEDAGLGFRAGLASIHTNALVLRATPQPLDEDFIEEAALPSIKMRIPVRRSLSVETNNVSWLPWLSLLSLGPMALTRSMLLSIDLAHQSKVQIALIIVPIVNRRARDRQHFALAPNDRSGWAGSIIEPSLPGSPFKEMA